MSGTLPNQPRGPTSPSGATVTRSSSRKSQLRFSDTLTHDLEQTTLNPRHSELDDDHPDSSLSSSRASSVYNSPLLHRDSTQWSVTFFFVIRYQNHTQSFQKALLWSIRWRFLHCQLGVFLRSYTLSLSLIWHECRYHEYVHHSVPFLIASSHSQLSRQARLCSNQDRSSYGRTPSSRQVLSLQ